MLKNITSSSPETSDRSGRWFAVAIGIVAIILGAGIIWLYAFGSSEQEARKTWTQASGLLKEVGLSYAPDAQYAPRYTLEIRFSFLADGREFEGTWIDGAATIYDFNEAKQLATRFTAEAASLSKNDLTILQSRKTWHLPFPGKAINVRYDPSDPRRAVMKTDLFPMTKVASSKLVWGIGLGFILLGILAFAALITDTSNNDQMDADS